jgi:hypothetical protein
MTPETIPAPPELCAIAYVRELVGRAYVEGTVLVRVHERTFDRLAEARLSATVESALGRCIVEDEYGDLLVGELV